MIRTAAALLLGLPVAAGLAGTLLPAFGWLPALGGERLSLDPWRALLADPAWRGALLLTLWTGFAATLASLALVLLFCAAAMGTPLFRRIQALLAPLLALPHAALAIGFAALVAPSGLLVRLASPWATGFERPPDWTIPNDPWGLALIAGLVLKEVPFLLLVTLAALAQVPAERLWLAARALGHRPVSAWFAVVWPQLVPQLRLPIAAVLAFSLSVVDVALILGPGHPPTLAVLVFRGFADPDLTRWFPAAAGATLLLVVTGLSLGLAHAAERGLAALSRRRALAGRRGGELRLLRRAAVGAMGGVLAASLAAVLLLALWSVAGPWRFPAAWPDTLSLATWRAEAGTLAAAAGTTLVIGVATTAIALALTLAGLEAEDRSGRRRAALGVIHLPLLVPQLAFLFGVQVALVALGVDGSLGAVIATHLLFVLPYLALSLGDPWRALDPRIARSAAALGASPVRILWAVKLPMLLRPILAASAVGFAVSVGLYLPTVFAGAGRVATLTTEALALAASGDRRVLAAVALLQAAMPLLAYAAALAVPAWLHRDRRGLAAG